MATPNWKTYDTNGDGKLTDAELTTWNNVVRTYKEYVDPNFEDTYEADIAASESTSVSPYEDGSASDSFYGDQSFADIGANGTEEETEAALIAAAETGNIDVIEAILSTASNAVSGAVLNTVMETFYDSFGIPAGLDDLSGYGSTPRPEFKVDLDSLAAIYLAAGSGNEIPLTEMDAQGLALGEHMRAVKENIQQTNAYVAEYGGSFWDYFVMPNLLVELSPLAQEYDADGNGSLDQAEMVEYTEAWEKENGIMRFADGTSATAATAASADLDGDGQISPQELEFWELNRGGDTDPNPSRTAFLADYGFDASPSAAWLDKFARESAESFQTGAQQILTQGLQDAALAILTIHQNGLLTQLESGADTLSRPIIDKDSPAYSIIGADIDSYFERIFDGKDTISRDALLTNDEFYDVGIQLATRNSSTPMLSAEGITLTDTDQALVDRYVAVRDDYQAEANFTFAGDPSAVTTDDIAAEKTKLLAAAQSPIAKASIGKLTDDQIRDRIVTERKNAAILEGLSDTQIYSPEFLENKRRLVKAGVDAIDAWTEPFEPEMQRNLKRLAYEGAINKLNDFADSIATTRDENGGWLSLDTKSKKMLNLASFGLSALGTTAQEMAGAISLIGETASDSILGRFGTAFVNLGASTETQDFADAANEVEARIGRATGFFDTAKAVFQDGVPVEYLLRMVVPEVGNEIILSRVFGGTTKGTKFKDADERFRDAILRTDRPTGGPEWLKDKLKTLGGIQPDELGDMAELVFATAGESFDRSYETAVKSGMSEEEALDYAYGVMGKTVTGAFLVNRIAAGLTIDDMVENFFPGADNKKAREALEAIYNHPTIRTALSAGDEAVSEGLEEAVATAITTTELVLIDDSIDVAGEVGQNAFFGVLFGSLVDLSMTAGFAIDSAAGSVIAARNPEINSVLTTAREEIDAGTDLATVTRNMEETLNGMGLANVASQTDILDSVNDAAFTTGAETERKFEELGYTPTEEEINEYIGKSNEADTLNNIDTYVDPRQVTVDEAKAELIAQGITDPSDAEIAQFTGQGDENFETSNIGKATDYANPLALSAAEIEDIAAKQGYTLAEGEAETLSGRVIPEQTEAEALANQENTFNDAAITEEELEAAAAAQGYTLTPEDRALIGNNPNAAQELLDADNRFNAGAITREEIETAARNAGIDPKDLTESDYALVGTIAEKDADGNFIPAEDILAGEQARFEGQVADTTAAGQKAAAEAAITAAVTAAGAPALSATDLERYVAMVIGGGLTIAEAVQEAENDIAAAAVTDDGGTTYTAGTYVDPDGDGVYQLVGEDGETLTGEFNEDGTAVTDTGTDESGTDQSGTDDGSGNQSVRDQVVAAIVAAGVELAQDKIDEIVDAVVSGAVTDIEEAVADKVTEVANVDSDTNTNLEEVTIDQDDDDYVRVRDFNAGVTALQNNIIKLINQLEAAGATRDEALAAAISGLSAELTQFNTSDQAEATKIIVDGVAAELGTTAADIAAIKVKLDTLVTKDDIAGLATRQDVLDAEGRLNTRIEQLQAEGKTRDEAVDVALGELATELGTTREAITLQLTNFQTELAVELSKLATKQDILDSEGRLNTRIEQLEAEGKTRDEAVDIALEELATELGTTREAITLQLTDFQTELNADLSKLATKEQVAAVEANILDSIEAYEAQGYSRDVAIQKSLDDANANIDTLAADLGTTKEAITLQLTDFQAKLEADLSLVATKEQVSTLEADLYLNLAEYEAQGVARDEATQLAVKDLATDLNTTEENILTQLGVTEGNIINRMNEVEVNLTNQFDITQDLITDTALATQDLITDTSLATQGLITDTALDTQQQIDTTSTQTQQQIQNRANQSAARDFFDMVLGSEDLEGQQVTVSQSPLAQINYIYDFVDPLANQQQRGFFGAASPYGESLAAGKRRRPQTIGSLMQGPLNLQGAPVGPMGMAAGGKVDYDFLNEISQIMSFGE